MTYRVAFVERTRLELVESGRGYARYRMPLAGNENHFDMLYMGAFTVLAEATAAIPGISILDTDRYFPIIKDIAVAFQQPATSDVFAKFQLDEPALQDLLADLERKGSATYVAEVPMHDAGGDLVATGKVTVKLLSPGWTKA